MAHLIVAVGMLASFLLTVVADENLSNCPGCEDNEVDSGGWCPTDYKPVGHDMCIMHVATLMSWTKARQYCHGVGGDLLAILSEEQQKTILAYFISPPDLLYEFETLELMRFWNNWLGATDVGTPGYWQWHVMDATLPMEVSFWSELEPDGEEKCLVMKMGLGNYDTTWSATACRRKYPFFLPDTTTSTIDRTLRDSAARWRLFQQ